MENKSNLYKAILQVMKAVKNIDKSMTVATCLNHPKKGKTQLFRKNVTEDMLNQIFEYPRKHTGKGYYKK